MSLLPRKIWSNPIVEFNLLMFIRKRYNYFLAENKKSIEDSIDVSEDRQTFASFVDIFCKTSKRKQK